LIEGLANVGLGKNGPAIASFDAILKQDPNYNAADRVLYELAFAQLAEKQDDAAADSFARLVKEHPASPLAPESSYCVGEQQYQAKHYPQAAEAYSAAVSKAGKSELGEKAGYKLAWAFFQQSQYDKAQQSFEHLVSEFPMGPHLSDGQFMAAECLLRQGKFEPAYAMYMKFVANPTGSKDSQARALLHAGQCATQLKKWTEGAQLLERAAKEFPDDPNSAEIAYELGACKQNLGDEAAALKLYETAADSQREVGARARFMMGEIMFGKKDFREGVKQFMKVAYGYGYPNASDATKKWQADAVFEAGRCFENLKQIDQAKKSYTEVIEKYPQSPRVAPAKTRLEALGS
jgi:TolA-binding protein